MKKVASVLILVVAIFALVLNAPAVFAGSKEKSPTTTRGMLGVNVVLSESVTQSLLSQLAVYGRIRDVVPEIRAVTLQTTADQIPALCALPFVAAANPDASRTGAPVDTVAAEEFTDGLGTWNLDLVNVTDFGFNNRQVAYDGTGVYVAVLDSGLVDSWRQYFPEERIATEFAACFGGGGGDMGFVSQQPNKWEHDQNSHGTHVTSTILGYSLGGTPINGVAPLAKIIPVKVLNQNGRGWSSVIARGITYVADLKAGPLAAYPVVINMSLGGPVLDAMEMAAIDYAIQMGVVIVASAGNRGSAGMGYPGGYEPVVSVAAAGWLGEWYPAAGGSWWYQMNAAEPTPASQLYITEFSSRQLAGQDLDVAAPGSWIVGPYQTNSGQTSYYFLGGTSMAAPHVAGIAALMLQKNPALTAADVEGILEGSATYIAPGSLSVYQPGGAVATFTWGADATGAGLATADAALAATP